MSILTTAELDVVLLDLAVAVASGLLEGQVGSETEEGTRGSDPRTAQEEVLKGSSLAEFGIEVPAEETPGILVEASQVTAAVDRHMD